MRSWSLAMPSTMQRRRDSQARSSGEVVEAYQLSVACSLLRSGGGAVPVLHYRVLRSGEERGERTFAEVGGHGAVLLDLDVERGTGLSYGRELAP